MKNQAYILLRYVYIYIYIYIYIFHIGIYEIKFLLFNFAINYENLLYNCLKMNTKLKSKLLFKLCIRGKCEHSNITSEYFQNSVIGTYNISVFNE